NSFRDEGLHRLPDELIFRKAVLEQRVVLTFDLDFGELLAAAGSQEPSVILFRLRNQTPLCVNPRLFEVLKTHRQSLQEGTIILVEDGGFRVRRWPIGR